MPQRMRAIVHDEYGPPGVLRMAEVERPEPHGDEVLVKVHTASVNAADWRLLMARPFMARLSTGLLRPKRRILGADVAGTVEAVGEKASRFRPGDAVFGDLGEHGRGGFAEYVCAREEAWAAKPDGLSWEDAAALPLAGTTALQGLRDAGQVRAGRTVLVHGASGGVGTFAVQIARYLGAEVTAACSAGTLDLARSLGAHHVVDRARADFTKGDGRWDVILAVNGYHPIRDYQRALAPGGTYVMVGGTSAQIFQALLLGPLLFATGGKRCAALSAKATRDDLTLLADLVLAGTITPVIDRRYPLGGVPDAIRHLLDGHPRGKVLVEVGADGAATPSRLASSPASRGSSPWDRSR